MDAGWLAHLAESGPFYMVLYKVFGEQAKRFAKAGGDRLLAGFEERTKTKQLQASLAETLKREALAWLDADDKTPELPPSAPAPELVLLEDARHLRELGGRARARLEARELWAQRNIEASFFFAVDEPPPPKIEGAPCRADPAKLDRILEGASKAYDEEAQRLWGRLLANEIVNPGRFSLRTLDVLRNLSSEEAQLFAKVCRFAINDPGILIRDGDLFEKASGMSLDAVMRLVEAGLISPDKIIAMRVTYYPSPDERSHIAVLRYFDRFLLIRRPMTGAEFSLSSYIFTTVGRELSQLVPQTGAPESRFLEEFAKWPSTEILDHAPTGADFERLFGAPPAPP
jgi:hypothetical protein